MTKPTQEQAFAMLAKRLEHARREHPVFADDVEDAILGAIGCEFIELQLALLRKEGPARIVDEALDVAATAMRLVMGEVED